MVSSLLGLFNLYKPISIAKFTHVISLNYSHSSNPNLSLTEDEGEGSERPSEPQSTPSPPHPSEAHVEPQSDLSPGPILTVKRKNQNKKKVLKTSKRRSVFKQGRKTIKSSKGAPTIPTNTEWDDLDMDIDDTMDYTLAQDKGKTNKVDEKGESTAHQQSTDRQVEGTDR
ncbi:hypothetical protein Tco_1216517, partial [Tanacetum coccineum]